MSGIAPLGPGFIPPADYNQYRSNGSADAANFGASRLERDTDSIELSPNAQRLALLDRVLNDPPVRQDLINQVRQEIASGRYDTPDKVNHAVDQLWSDFFSNDSSVG